MNTDKGFKIRKILKFASCCHLQAGDVPVEFEEFHLSEVQNMASEEKLEQVLTSMKTNKVAMKGSYTKIISFIVHIKVVIKCMGFK